LNSFNKYHIFAFTYTCPPPPIPLVQTPSTHGRTYSTLLFSNFVEENTRQKKMTYFLVCDKGSYTGSFLVIFPCIITPRGSSCLFFFILHSTWVPFLWWFQTV
jgi:hypothetical protein